MSGKGSAWSNEGTPFNTCPSRIGEESHAPARAEGFVSCNLLIATWHSPARHQDAERRQCSKPCGIQIYNQAREQHASLSATVGGELAKSVCSAPLQLHVLIACARQLLATWALDLTSIPSHRQSWVPEQQVWPVYASCSVKATPLQSSSREVIWEASGFTATTSKRTHWD